ncbi:MAG: hypothetical protein ABI456_23240 [Ktedonobacteraceae bacterium]
MRHIKYNLAVSASWQQKAQQAYDIVKNLPPAERAKAINDRSRIWKALKEDLQKLSHGKCWYCESFESTAPGDVDHYRPKNEVEECPHHTGYWWLAFAWSNYRYGCELCNRINNDPETDIKGGKGSAFPLCDETQRVFDEHAPAGLLREEPALLDPTVAADPPLLTFDEDGTARPSRNQLHFPKEYLRADTSIRVYHLNRQKLKNRRQFAVCSKVKELIEEGNEYLSLATLEGSIGAREGYKRVVKRLSDMIDEQADYSAAAKAILKIYRNHEWVDELLCAA